VVGISPDQFRYQVDLGSAWMTWTGLPFVFAVWAADRARDTRALADMLCAARDRGLRKAGQLAVEYGPGHGWPAALAQQYLERYLTFGLTDKHVEGMIRFFDLATASGLAPHAQKLQAAS
jgi:chorismate dehydratase